MSDFFSGLNRVLPFVYGAVGEAFTKMAGDPSAYAPPPEPPRPPAERDSVIEDDPDDERLPPGWRDNGEIHYSLSQEPDFPIAFGAESPWYVAKAGSALEVVAKMELEIFCEANWKTGLAACRQNDFIFVTPQVRGRVYAVGVGCDYDLQDFATMGARFAEFMRFDPQRIAWAKCETGGLTRSLSFSGVGGVVESFGEPTEEEVELGLDRCSQPGFDVRGFLVAQLSGRQDAVGDLARAWGVDSSFAGVYVEPECGLVCRPARLGSRRNIEDQLTLDSSWRRWVDNTDPDPADADRVRSFFLPFIAPDIDPEDLDYDVELKFPTEPPPGWAQTHSPDDDSYLEAHAFVDEWISGYDQNGRPKLKERLQIDMPHGQRVFDAIYEASVASGWLVRDASDTFLAFNDDQLATLVRVGSRQDYEFTYLWIDSAEALRAFHGDCDLDYVPTDDGAQSTPGDDSTDEAEVPPPIQLPVIHEVLTGEQMDAWLSAQYAGAFTRRGFTDFEDCDITVGYDQKVRVGLCRVFDYTDSNGVEFTAVSRKINPEIDRDSRWISRVIDHESRFARQRGESGRVYNVTDYAEKWAMSPPQREALARIVRGSGFKIVYEVFHGPMHESFADGAVKVVFQGKWANLDRVAQLAAEIAAEYGNPAYYGSTAASVNWLREGWRGVPEVELVCKTDWSQYSFCTVRSRFVNRPSERIQDAAEYLAQMRVRYTESRNKFFPPHLHATDDVPAEWLSAYRARQRAQRRRGR